MDDLISRQAAIDALHMHLMYRLGTDSNKKRLDEWINSLPSAQPAIIHCHDCKHYYYADNRIPQEQRFVCELEGERWKPDDFCSYAERREE